MRVRTIAAAVCVAVLVSLLGVPGTAVAGSTQDQWTNTLTSGHALVAGTTHSGLRTASGEFQLGVDSYFMELDQFAPMFGRRGPDSAGTGLWWRDDATGHLQNGHDHTMLRLSPHGWLVFETSRHKVLWSDHRLAGWHSRLVLTRGGDLVLYSRYGKVVWSSHTTAIYLPAGRTLASGRQLNGRWADQQRGAQLTTLRMQADGNLVYRCNGKLDWQSHTFVHGSYLIMQTNGNLVIRTPKGRPVWASRTWRGGSYTWLDAGRMEVNQDTTRTVRTLWSAHIPYNAPC